jgi:hypothetical protein
MLGTRAVSFCNGLIFVVPGLSYTADDGKRLTSRFSGQAACLDYVWFPPVPWAFERAGDRPRHLVACERLLVW